MRQIYKIFKLIRLLYKRGAGLVINVCYFTIGSHCFHRTVNIILRQSTVIDLRFTLDRFQIKMEVRMFQF